MLMSSLLFIVGVFYLTEWFLKSIFVLLISKLDSGLWFAQKIYFPLKNFFNLRHTASFILYTFLFIFYIKPCSQVSCICDVDVDRERITYQHFFHRKKSEAYHPAKRSINANNYKSICGSNNHKNKFQ